MTGVAARDHRDPPSDRAIYCSLVGASPAICQTRTADGVRIAYHVLGSGPPLLLSFPYHVNDLVLNWGVPAHRQAMLSLADHFTVVNLDFRGAGRSSRDIDRLTLDDLCEDVHAVLRDVGIDRASVCALGSSCTIAAELAACFPESVSRMVLVEAGESESSEHIFALQRLNPAIGADARATAIGGVSDPLNTAALAEVIRSAVDPEVFARYERVRAENALQELLAGVEAPTLFLHAAEDELIPVQVAQRLAGSMPDARLLAVPTFSGMGVWNDDVAMERLVSFLDGTWSGDPDDPTTGKATTHLPIGRGRLSPREREVLRLVALGRTNGQVADQLFISPNTVSHHLKTIFAKTGSANRTEAAAFAHRHGLVR